MSARDFFSDTARAGATKLVTEIEAGTAAEIVVAVRPSSGSYRAADLLFGFVIAEIVLSLILFLPQVFWLETIPVDILLGFVSGALLASRVPPLRRLFTTAAQRRRHVSDAAAVAFHDLGVARTTTRLGVLVYVSLLERRVELVADVAVDVRRMGDAWREAQARLDAALTPPRLDAFTAALRGLAEPLAFAHPHQPDDVNELPDEASVQA